MLLTGYISRSELKYAMGMNSKTVIKNLLFIKVFIIIGFFTFFLDKARRNQGISSSSSCYFSSNLPILDSSPFIDFQPWMDQVI